MSGSELMGEDGERCFSVCLRYICDAVYLLCAYLALNLFCLVVVFHTFHFYT